MKLNKVYFSYQVYILYLLHSSVEQAYILNYFVLWAIQNPPIFFINNQKFEYAMLCADFVDSCIKTSIRLKFVNKLEILNSIYQIVRIVFLCFNFI